MMTLRALEKVKQRSMVLEIISKFQEKYSRVIKEVSDFGNSFKFIVATRFQGIQEYEKAEHLDW